jgi:hypothetical protein
VSTNKCIGTGAERISISYDQSGILPFLTIREDGLKLGLKSHVLCLMKTPYICTQKKKRQSLGKFYTVEQKQGFDSQIYIYSNDFPELDTPIRALTYTLLWPGKAPVPRLT